MPKIVYPKVLKTSMRKIESRKLRRFFPAQVLQAYLWQSVVSESALLIYKIKPDK